MRFLIEKIIGDLFVETRRPHMQTFLLQTENVERTQTDRLWHFIKNAQKSEFAQKFGLDSIKTIAEYQARLPIQEYEDLRPWIEAVYNGNPRALFSDLAALDGFGLTSGTTAKPKLIPFTQACIESYLRAWQLWGISAFPAHPGIYGGSILALTGEERSEKSPDGLNVGSMASLTAQRQMYLVRRRYVVESWMNAFSDTETRHYAIMRQALATPDVTFVTTANPSTLIQLARWTKTHATTLIRDIHDGRAEWNGQKFARDFRGGRSRAHQLEKLLTEDKFRPVDYWPRLALVAVWLGGTLSWYRSELDAWYPKTPKRDPGLIATEGRFTIPMNDDDASGVLDVGGAFYEFLPVDAPGQTTLLAHQLEVGRDYEIVVTTSGGLFRYRMHDIVRCTGKTNDAPKLAFLRKDGGFWNFTGEKISADQVSMCFSVLTQRNQIHTDRLVLAPVFADTPYYALVCEAPLARHEQLATDIDNELQRINIEYRAKRQSQRLGPVRMLAVSEQKWREWEQEIRKNLSTSLEQIKRPVLISDINVAKKLTQS